MTNRVVLDTNILVSSLLTNGPPATIVDMVAGGKFRPFYNDRIISEYWSVLQRPKFNFHPSQVSRLIDDIMRAGIAVETNTPGSIAMPDEDDRKFYDVTLASSAILITGSIRHFPVDSFIVTPADFLKMYQSDVSV